MDSLLHLLPSFHLSTILTVSFSVFALYLIRIIFRRQNWRNSPPGPVGWPIVGYLPYVSGRLHEDFFHLAKTYGALFSIKLGMQPAIVISSPDMAKEFLRHKDATFSSRVITEAVKIGAYDATTLVFVPYGARWRLLRKIMTMEVFSSRAMELFQPARQQQVKDIINILRSAAESQTAVDIADAMFVVSTNIISNLICSKSLFNNTKKEGLKLKEMVGEALGTVGQPNVADMIPFLKPFDPQGLQRRVTKVAKRFDDFFEKLIDDRLEERSKGLKVNENGRLDLLDVFLDYKSDKKDEESFTRVDIKGMLMDMFTAGADTTSSTIEWGITEILRNPRVYNKVLEELDQVVGRNRYVEETDIAKLPYFQAVTKEVFRLHPAVPVLIPRRADEDCEVFGYHVPKHAMVFVNVWGISRDPNVWSDPYEFKPERFLGSDVDVKGLDFELLPFGTGRRSCVGMPLGNRMVQYCLASVIHAFEWEFPRDVVQDVSEKAGLTLQKAKTLVGIPNLRLEHYM